MNKIRALKYMNVLILPLLAIVSFNTHGWLTYLPLIEAFAFIPLLELTFKPNPANFSKEREEERKNDSIYDWQLYIMVPIQFLILGMFFISMSEPGLTLVDQIGRITAMGLMCGVIGINVAHELGHRNTWYEQLMAKALLLTSLYMHFFIEHNRGHHKHVSTKEDPSSARYGEMLYTFWVRSVVFAYLSAWKLEAKRLKKKGVSPFSIHNEMLRFQIIQVAFTLGIGLLFGWIVMGYFIAAAIMGFLLLETVNYIEHYGLERNKKGDVYERVMPHHSWNSDHKLGRIILFELSRHSDHHYIASRKYQILRHIDESPQMPTGYPGMMILAIFPPLWFAIMNPRIKQIQQQGLAQAA
ncbi:alkane 1-monooxygenase [Ekhidna lutea]|uniref:Alkane 1-monooxygenase n=1 Tax=Ekhidna lutea TaxID=447679 RepID=A0A239M1W8_EKHLU|nr:alkane 1-monooxygenase [Ekhidna lutea]SNT36570.1 alkane 1-monooxygenase [Ekhidna lutea]